MAAPNGWGDSYDFYSRNSTNRNPLVPEYERSNLFAANGAGDLHASTSKDPNGLRERILSGPRFDQEALDFASSAGDGLTLSHAHTTEYTESSIGDDSEDAEIEGLPSKKKRKMAASTYSFNSADASQFVKEDHGRAFNTLVDAYPLPSDNIEFARLDKQHVATLLAMDGLTPCEEIVEAVLAPVEGDNKQILDIGCGSGTWVIEMARKYPHASVIGIDLAPPPVDTSQLPSNLRFEIDDVNHGLMHFHNQFDLVHMRSVSGGIQRFEETMKELEQCLKPGGLVIIVDGDGTIYSEDRLHPAKLPSGDWHSDSDREGSWFRKVVLEGWEASDIAGSSTRVAEVLQDLGFWEHPLCDPETAVSGGFYLPIGPWVRIHDQAQSQRLQYAGALIRQAFLNIHRGYHKILRTTGMDQATLDRWSANVDKELTETTVKLWVRFRFCWARRRTGPDQPAPPLPSIPSNSPSPSEANNPPFGGEIKQTRYPFIEFYTTQEEAKRQLQRRKDALGTPPFPEVRKSWARMQAEKMARGEEVL